MVRRNKVQLLGSVRVIGPDLIQYDFMYLIVKSSAPTIPNHDPTLLLGMGLAM